MKKILVIAAHPDDEVYGMGGTIAKLTGDGNEVYVLIVTDGSTSQYRNCDDLEEIIEEKKKQTKKANDILGVKKVYYGQLADMELDSTKHIVINEVIEKTIDEIKPDIVYTHFYGDVNLDHQEVYKSTLVATRPTPTQCVKELYCYSVASSTEWSPQISKSVFMPNVFVKISKEEAQKKLDAIKAYSKELRDYPHPRSVEYMEKMDVANGLKCGIERAEEFMCIRRIIK